MVSSHDSLEDHLKTNFAFMYFHKVNMEDLNNMMPWERDIYIMLYEEQIKKEEEERKNNK